MLKGIHPIRLEIYRSLLFSVAEEMGTVLKRTAYSPNIKERRDYSCAVFDWRGDVLAMGDHMPVHLGSMPMSVRSAIEHLKLTPGDLALLNDPFAGGTHLPDITVVLPVYAPGRLDKPIFFVSARAHHSDVGGISPGSMPLSRDIFQEGIRIPPVKLYESGRLNRDVLQILLHNVRTPREREGDLAAQVAAVRIGERRLVELIQKHGEAELKTYAGAIHDYAAVRMEQLIEQIPDGTYSAEDWLDDDGVLDSGEKPAVVAIRVQVTVKGKNLKIDFSGTHAQVPGCLNAVEAITVSAVHYVLRCLAPEDMPSAQGLMRPIELVIPRGSVVNASYPAATAAGNVETSQRIVDVVLKAFAAALPGAVPSASSGTMNNITIGGIDPVSGAPFSYYETIGGGMGGGPLGQGDNGIHTHMTNSLNTPVEALEPYFPFRIREYRLRNRSGGVGLNRGGDGIIRSYEMLAENDVTMLSERREYAPYGLQGGRPGKKGMNFVVVKGRNRRLPGKFSARLAKGEILRVETPGGGGWGKKGRPSSS